MHLALKYVQQSGHIPVCSVKGFAMKGCLITRREFLANVAAASATSAFGASALSEDPLVRFGLFTDLHYANKNMADGGGVAGKVYYREGLSAISAAIGKLNPKGLDFMIELGDFKDTNVSGASGKANALTYLVEAEAEYAKFSGDRYHVLGNHDMDSLTKAEFLSHVTNAGQASALANYTFVKNGVRFVVLDTNYLSESDDSNYSEGNWAGHELTPHLNVSQLTWLGDTLAESEQPCIVCSHHRLDSYATSGHNIVNYEKVVKIFAQTGKVRAVLNGHQHSGGINNAFGVFHYNFRSAAWADHVFYEVEYYASGRLAVRESPTK